MDQTYPDLMIGKRTVSAEGVVCCCSGAVIPILDADEWSDFAFGQLVALGVATIHSDVGHTCVEPMVDWVSTNWRIIFTHKVSTVQHLGALLQA